MGAGCYVFSAVLVGMFATSFIVAIWAMKPAPSQGALGWAVLALIILQVSSAILGLIYGRTRRAPRQPHRQFHARAPWGVGKFLQRWNRRPRYWFGAVGHSGLCLRTSPLGQYFLASVGRVSSTSLAGRHARRFIALQRSFLPDFARSRRDVPTSGSSSCCSFSVRWRRICVNISAPAQALSRIDRRCAHARWSRKADPWPHCRGIRFGLQ